MNNNETILYFRAETADNKFEEFSMVLPNIVFTQQDWDFFKQTMPAAFAMMNKAKEEKSAEEAGTKVDMAADLEVTPAAA